MAVQKGVPEQKISQVAHARLAQKGAGQTLRHIKGFPTQHNKSYLHRGLNWGPLMFQPDALLTEKVLVEGYLF